MKEKNPKTKKLYGYSKYFVCIFLLPFSLFLPLLTVFLSSTANAAIQGIEAQHDRTKLVALQRCINNDASPDKVFLWTNEIRGSLGNKFNLNGIMHMSTSEGEDNIFGNKNAIVGHEIDSSDGQAACPGINIVQALRAINATPEELLKIAYKNIGPDSSGTIRWTIKDEYCDDGYGDSGLCDDNWDEDGISADISAWIRSKMNQRDLGVSPAERERRIAGAFWHCYEKAPANPDKETYKIGDDKYQLRDDNKLNDRISVGYDVEHGDWQQNSGTFTCETLKNLTTAQMLKDHPEGSGPGADSESDAGINDADCDSGSVLGWIVCPVAEFTANFASDVFEDVIRPMMENVPISNKPGSGSFEAWQSFRILANVILVGSLLAIVYAQGRGGE